MKSEFLYLDHASTTFLLPEVKDAMLPYMDENSKFGNPSSIHFFGRESKIAIEKSRKSIAGLLKTSPAQIFFTSGGTESDNMAIISSYFTYKFSTIITSRLEHHAVLHACEFLNLHFGVKIIFLQNETNGNIDLEDLKLKLIAFPNSFVSLMHGNNEVGNMINLYEIGVLVKSYNCIFHSDTVQTMGYFNFDLSNFPIDFLVAAGHKFHAPKGIGFIYINNEIKIKSFIQGGSQERNMRGGTENLASIVGLAKAFEIAQSNLLENIIHLKNIKSYFIHHLKQLIPNVRFNGNCDNLEESLPHIVNVAFPKSDIDEMLLFKFDINKICVSGGSACTSGALGGSHVLNAIYGDLDDLPSVRFSFSGNTTIDDINHVLSVIKSIFKL